MKNFFSFAALWSAATILTLSSCNKMAEAGTHGYQPDDAYGTVSLSIDVDDAVTRASDNSTYGAEALVGDVQVLLFDNNGNVASYLGAGTSLNPSVRIKAGSYTCVAVINGPGLEMVRTKAEYDATALDLAAYNGSDFVMAGSASDVEVAQNADVQCTISASRFVSRVRLASVVNNCPVALGSVTLKRAYISNVVCNQNIGGTAVPSDFSNMYGVAAIADSNSIIDGTTYPAVPATLTLADLASADLASGASTQPGSRMYAYPNPYEDAVKAWKASWTPTATRLVLVAEVNGNEFYYPVAIPQMVRNTSYDVSMTITGEGLKDPQGDPSALADKGTLSVSIVIADWTSGTEYNVEY